MSKKLVTVLGSTGSIGKQALDVIRYGSDRFRLFGIAANHNVEMLIKQATIWHPLVVACAEQLDASDFPEGTELLCGENAATLLAAMPEADIVVNGISGMDALAPLLASLKAGKRVALANKESIVCGHDLVDAMLEDSSGEILPVDSEQSAIFQCLSGGRYEEVEKLWLTASGGPFWQLEREDLKHVTVKDALQHPTWSMGTKITIDSATLFNKGLEVMEASYLFHMPVDRIDVLIHPQSIVHSMVEFKDGTIMANLSCPDMRLPIQYAMTFPDRVASPARRLNLATAPDLTFHLADRSKYAGIRLAYYAWYEGGTMPVVYHAANEAAVELFLREQITFTDIADIVDYCMNKMEARPINDVADITAAAGEARTRAAHYFHKHLGH